MVYYGKYWDYPPSLRMLMEVEEELKNSLYSLDTILLLEEKPFVYPITPYDVITFASTGVDGIHFGFLTDFGQVEDLEEAYIVCVSPMNFDHPIKIIARNIKEFLRLLITVRYESSLIENFNNYSREKEYLQLFAKIKKSRISPEYEEQVQLICDKLSDTFGISTLDNLYEYIEGVTKREREKVIGIETLDGLGVVHPNATDNYSSLSLTKDNFADIEFEEFEKFFAVATTASKLACIRDIQFIIPYDYYDGLKDLIGTELLKMNLPDVAYRFNLSTRE